MDNLRQDLRYAFRALRKSPGFAAVTIAVLALGIGANTAIFSVVHAVLLKPLPYPEPDRLVTVPHIPPQDIFHGRKYFAVSPANYYDWKAENTVFTRMAMAGGGFALATGSGEPASIPAYYVTPEFFSIIGVPPLLGRLIGEGDDKAGKDMVVLSEEIWRSRYGANPSIIGTTTLLDGRATEIIGVLPKGKGYPLDVRVWAPLTLSPEEKAIRGAHDFEVVARLKDGVTLEAARAQMNTIAANLAARYPADNKGWGAAVLLLHEDMVGDVRQIGRAS